MTLPCQEPLPGPGWLISIVSRALLLRMCASDDPLYPVTIPLQPPGTPAHRCRHPLLSWQYAAPPTALHRVLRRCVAEGITVLSARRDVRVPPPRSLAYGLGFALFLSQTAYGAASGTNTLQRFCSTVDYYVSHTP